MTSKHTPEPWHFLPGDLRVPRIGKSAMILSEPLVEGQPFKGHVVTCATCPEHDANLARAAACVNKLAGHDDLSQVAVIPTATLAEVRKELRAAYSLMASGATTAHEESADGIARVLTKLGEG